MTTSIRAVRAEERDQWELLFAAYAEFYKATLPENCKDEVWAWIFNDDEAFWCDVTVNGQGQLIGFVQYQLMHRSLGGSKVCYLSDLFVSPTNRKTGAGKAMIDHVIAFAKDNKIANVRWLTQEQNHTAKSLYETYVAQSEFVLYSLPVDG